MKHYVAYLLLSVALFTLINLMKKNLLLSTILVIGTTSSYASLIGHNLSVESAYPDIGSLSGSAGSFTVDGSTFLYTGFGSLKFEITADADTITISKFQWNDTPVGNTLGFSGPPGSPNGAMDAGVTFAGLLIDDLTAAWGSVALDSVVSLPGFDSSRVAVSGNQIALNFMGINYTHGESEVVLSVEAQTVVPDAGSSFLMAFAGIASIAAARRLF